MVSCKLQPSVCFSALYPHRFRGNEDAVSEAGKGETSQQSVGSSEVRGTVCVFPDGDATFEQYQQQLDPCVFGAHGGWPHPNRHVTWPHTTSMSPMNTSHAMYTLTRSTLLGVRGGSHLLKTAVLIKLEKYKDPKRGLPHSLYTLPWTRMTNKRSRRQATGSRRVRAVAAGGINCAMARGHDCFVVLQECQPRNCSSEGGEGVPSSYRVKKLAHVCNSRSHACTVRV